MDYQIIFSPDLDLNAIGFAKEWNSTEPFNGLAVARLEDPARSQQSDPSFNDFIATLSSIPIGLSRDTLNEAVSTFFKKRGNSVKVKFIPQENNDGSIIVAKRYSHYKMAVAA